MGNKFKVGDKIVGNEKANVYAYTIKDWEGIVASVNERGFGATSIGGTRIFSLNYECFDKVNSALSITITQKGNKTIAVYKQGDKFIKSGTARYNPDDAKDGVPYSFEVGAKYAFERLFGIEKKVKAAEPNPFKKAKVGDRIKIVNENARHTPITKIGQELKASIVENNGIYTENDNFFYDRDKEYIILEDVKAVGYKEVKRKANIGEYVKIVNAKNFSDDDYYSDGDICKVLQLQRHDMEGVFVETKGTHPCNIGKNTSFIYTYEYVVLENYNPNTIVAKLDLSTISKDDFWNELQRRLGDK